MLFFKKVPQKREDLLLRSNKASSLVRPRFFTFVTHASHTTPPSNPLLIANEYKKKRYTTVHLFFWRREEDSNLQGHPKSPLFSRDSAIIRQSFAKLFSYHKILFNTKPKKAKSAFLGFFILDYIIFNISYKQNTSVFYFNAYMGAPFLCFITILTVLILPYLSRRRRHLSPK